MLQLCILQSNFYQKIQSRKALEKHKESKGDEPNQELNEEHVGHSNVSGSDQDASPSTSQQSNKGKQQGKQINAKKRGQRKRKAYTAPSTLNSTQSSDTGLTSKGKAKCKACSWEGKSLRAHLS